MEVGYVAKKFAVVTAFLLMGTGPLYAQNYPTKVITVIVPFAAGGPTDTVARLVAVPMSKTLKQQVIVENVGGAGGTIGANEVAKAPADGYTLFLHRPFDCAGALSHSRCWRYAAFSFRRLVKPGKKPSSKEPADDFPPLISQQSFSSILRQIHNPGR
jgi:hypothetical protein